MAVETLEVLFRPLEEPTGLSATYLNEAYTPEILGTIVGDVIFDTVLRKVGSAIGNLVTGVGLLAASILGKEYMTPSDRAFVHNLAAHHLTRVLRLGSPGEFSAVLGQARELGMAFGEKRYQDVLRGLVKTPETLSSEIEEARRVLETLVPAPAPAPAPVPAPPAPAPAPVAEIL
ncbi:MAG: hypothetical protein QW356_06315 [Candidatus Hadarchaeales archaeon]